MPIFSRKKPQPMWYVLRPPRNHNPDVQPNREGPYTRPSIAQMLVDGQLDSGAMIWTNEKIFPNPNPNSMKKITIQEWRRLDQIPDPVFQKLQAEGYALKHPSGVQSTPPASSVGSMAPPSGSQEHFEAAPPGAHPQQHPNPQPYSNSQPSLYPAGNAGQAAYPQQPYDPPQGYPASHPQQPSVYPQGYHPPGA